MSTGKRKILYEIYHGKVERDFYTKNREVLNAINYNAIKMLYLFGAIYMIILSVLTLVSKVVSESAVVHYTSAILLISGTIITRTLIDRHSFMVKPLYLALIVILLGDSLYMGVYSNPHIPTVIFFINLIMLPVLFIDRPGNSMLIVTIGSIVFIIATVANRRHYNEIMEVDLLNAIFVIIIAYMSVSYTRNLHLINIQSKLWFKEQSQTDQLSGIHNKMHTEYLCKQYISNLCKTEGYTFMILDMDDFKQLNDTYGHKMGDEVIERFGEILRSSFRSSDIVGRIGGDEFAVLLKSLGCYKTAERRAGEIQNKINMLGQELCVENLSVSIGINVVNDNSVSFGEMFDKADSMLYKAKKDGKTKSCVVRYS